MKDEDVAPEPQESKKSLAKPEQINTQENVETQSEKQVPETTDEKPAEVQDPVEEKPVETEEEKPLDQVEATEVVETAEKKEETENNENSEVKNEESEVKPDEGSKKELQETPQEVQNNESSNVEEKAESQVVVTKDSVIDQTQQEPTGEVFNKNNEPPKSEKEVFEAKKMDENGEAIQDPAENEQKE